MVRTRRPVPRIGWSSLLAVGLVLVVSLAGERVERRAIGPVVPVCSRAIGPRPIYPFPGASLAVPGLDTDGSSATLASVSPERHVSVQGTQQVGTSQTSCGPRVVRVALDGTVSSDVDMTSWGPGRVDVVARGLDGAVWHAAVLRVSAETTETVVLPWESLGGFTRGAPTIAAAGVDRVRVFARGGDDALWTREWAGAGWLPWIRLGGTLRSAPDAASAGPVGTAGTDRYDIVALGIGGRVCHAWFIDGLGPWECFDGTATSSATIGVASGELGSIFVRGADYALWSRHYAGTGAWSAWFPVGGRLVSSPDADYVAPGDVRVAMRGTDDRLWTTSGDGTAFGPFFPRSI